jgi:dephospho-CoA kinase
MGKLVIGLIGGIGSGKSAVAAEFGRHGAAIISGDQLGHEALRQPSIRHKVVETFGNGIIKTDSDIDRRKLADIVFADVGRLRELEQIVFPWIVQGLEEQVASAQRDSGALFIVVDAAVMFEAGWNKACDKIVYVHAPPEQRLIRLTRQRGWTAEQVQSRSRTQLSLTEKASRADAAIDNAGSPEAMAGQVADLVKQWVFPVAFQKGFGENSK